MPSINKIKLPTHPLRKCLSGTAVSPKGLSPPSTGIFWTFDSFPKTTLLLPSRRAMSYITPCHHPTQTHTTNNETHRAKAEAPEANALTRWLPGGQAVQPSQLWFLPQSWSGNVGSLDCKMENQVCVAKANRPFTLKINIATHLLSHKAIIELLACDYRSWNCNIYLLQLPYYTTLTYAEVIR